jgi:nucleoside-diphosphate-sugar epimerase
VKALVTGGGGFIGSHVARRLHKHGDKVTALGRHRYPQLEKAGIQTVQVDLRDAEGVRRASANMDIVYHVGAIPGIWGKRQEFRDINVGGTRNVLEACRAAGVRRLVFTSTPSVVFGEEELCGVDESQPYPSKYLAAYPMTKAIAERMVLEANGPNLATVALRPHLVWGPGDPNLIPRIIQRAREGKLVQVGDGTNLVDITYIDNATEAHVLAGDALSPGAPCAGRAYFISQGEPVVLWSWINELLLALGVPTVGRTISHRKARWIGALFELAHGVLGVSSEPRMTRFLADQLARSHYFSIEAARRDLGYEPRVSTEEGLRRLVSSLEES